MNKTITLNLSRILAIVVSVGILGIAGQALLWSLQPSTVLTVNNEPVPAEPPEIQGGDKIHLTVDFCQSISAVATTRLRLVGAEGALIPVNWPTGRVEKGCNTYPDIPIPIPGQTPTDTYYAEFITCYYINPLKNNQCTTFRSKTFKVVNSVLNPGDAKVQ